MNPPQEPGLKVYYHRQFDLPTQTEYLQHLKAKLNNNRYLTVLKQAQAWSHLNVDNGCDEQRLKEEILQIAHWLADDPNLIRELNSILPYGIALFYPPKPSPEDHCPDQGYVTILTKARGDILPLQPSPVTGQFHVTCSSEDLLAAQPKNDDWSSCHRRSRKDGWRACLLDLLSREIDAPSNNLETQRLAFRRQRDLAKEVKRIPSHLFVQRLEADKAQTYHQSNSSFAEIYKGRSSNRVVCVKIPQRQGSPEDDDRATQVVKATIREVFTWWRLHHPNVLPFLGVNKQAFGAWALVVPWTENADLLHYTNMVRGKVPAFRENAICDIVQGLAYLHSLNPPVAHGDLRASHVLVDEQERCFITNFGINTIQGADKINSLSSHGSGSRRWQPQEVYLDGLHPLRDKFMIDVYAFGCVVLEIYTGQVPQYLTANKTLTAHGMQVVESIKTGIRPQIPSDLPEEVDVLMHSCWKQPPSSRPKMAKLAKQRRWQRREAVEKADWSRRGNTPEELSKWIAQELSRLQTEGKGMEKLDEESQCSITMEPEPYEEDGKQFGYRDSKGRVKRAARLLRIRDVCNAEERLKQA